MLSVIEIDSCIKDDIINVRKQWHGWIQVRTTEKKMMSCILPVQHYLIQLAVKLWSVLGALGPDYMSRAGPVSRAGLSSPGSQHVC